MSKLLKKKILVSVISVLMVALVIGNIYSLATENGGGSGVLELTETGSTNSTNNSKNNTKANSSSNVTADVDQEVGAQNTKNTNTNKSTNTNTNTSSRYSNKNTSATSGLPYAGSNTSIIFIVIALGVSAAYAYKKVSDYNV